MVSTWRNYGYFLSLLPAVCVVFGNLLGGWWAASNLVYSLLVMALLEILTGSNKSNLHTDSKSSLPQLILFLHVTMHTLVVISLFYGIHQGILTGPFLILAALSSGIEAGSGAVVIAHEYIHKDKAWAQFAGRYLLMLSGNVYFQIHHLRVHHKLVGMPEDAATARRGESLYRFFWRTIREQFVQGWETEQKRLAKIGKGAFNLQNAILQNIAVQVFIIGLVFFLTGIAGVLAWLIVIIIAALLLEYVNYIEHYGLVRQAGDRVQVVHSWNCDKIISRFVLIDLSRHSDHHFHASKPYHMLESHAASPSLPGGYVSLILPALIPVWWFQIVHPRLDSQKNRE